MNNKGFAITGILYTIFALFILLIFAALTNLSFKRQVLATSVAKMEEELAMEEIDDINSTYDENRMAMYDGKYVFEFNYQLLDQTSGTFKTHTIDCVAYLKKGETIEPEGGENFPMIPKDCSEYPSNIILSLSNDVIVPDRENMTLKEVYKFKDSD